MLCLLCLVGWGQTLFYHNRMRVWKVIPVVSSVGSVAAGFEYLLVVAIRKACDRGMSWPVTLNGSIAAALVLVGLIPPYFELAKRRGRVVGISFKFLAIDILGAVFSLIALAIQNTFDLLGGLFYILALIMELGIVGSHLVWLYRTRKSLTACRDSGISSDSQAESPGLRSSWYKCWGTRRISVYSKSKRKAESVSSNTNNDDVVQRPENVIYSNNKGEKFRYWAAI